jgi:RNA recognition motif-containing protein
LQFFQPDVVYKPAQDTACNNDACQRTKSARISEVDDYSLFLNQKEKHKNLQYVKEHFNSYFSSKNLRNRHKVHSPEPGGGVVQSR